MMTVVAGLLLVGTTTVTEFDPPVWGEVAKGARGFSLQRAKSGHGHLFFIGKGLP